MKLSRTVGLAVAGSLVAGTVAAIAQIGGAPPADPPANVVDAAGHLRVPADYRTLYQALGRTSFVRIDKVMSSLPFVASVGRFTGYDPG